LRSILSCSLIANSALYFFSKIPSFLDYYELFLFSSLIRSSSAAIWFYDSLFLLSNSIDKSIFYLFKPSNCYNFSDIYSSFFCFEAKFLLWVVSVSSFIFNNKTYFLVRFSISIYLYSNYPLSYRTVADEFYSFSSNFPLF